MDDYNCEDYSKYNMKVHSYNPFSNIPYLQGHKYDLFEAKKEFAFKDKAKKYACFGKYIAVTAHDKLPSPTPCMVVIIGNDLRVSYIAFMTEENSRKEFLDWVNQLSFGNSIVFKGVI